MIDPSEVATKAGAPMHDALAGVRPQFQEAADAIVTLASANLLSAAAALVFVSELEEVLHDLIASTFGAARESIEKQIEERSVADG